MTTRGIIAPLTGAMLIAVVLVLAVRTSGQTTSARLPNPAGEQDLLAVEDQFSEVVARWVARDDQAVIRLARNGVEDDAANHRMIHYLGWALFRSGDQVTAAEVFAKGVAQDALCPHCVEGHARTAFTTSAWMRYLVLVPRRIGLVVDPAWPSWSAEPGARAGLARRLGTQQPSTAVGLWLHGNFLFDSNNYEDAASAYAAASTVDADFAVARLMHAWTLRSLGRLDDAISEATSVAQQLPQWPDALYAAASMISERGSVKDIEQAAEYARRAIACLPKGTDLRRVVQSVAASAALRLGRLPEAERLITRAIVDFGTVWLTWDANLFPPALWRLRRNVLEDFLGSCAGYDYLQQSLGPDYWSIITADAGGDMRLGFAAASIPSVLAMSSQPGVWRDLTGGLPEESAAPGTIPNGLAMCGVRFDDIAARAPRFLPGQMGRFTLACWCRADAAASIVALENAVAVAPDYLHAWRWLGDLRLGQDDFVRARKAFAKCVELDALNPIGWTGLASVELREGNAHACILAATRAMRLFASRSCNGFDYPEAFALRAAARRAQGDRAGADRDLDDAFAFGGTARAYLDRAKLRLAAGNRNEALADLTETVNCAQPLSSVASEAGRLQSGYLCRQCGGSGQIVNSVVSKGIRGTVTEQCLRCRGTGYEP